MKQTVPNIPKEEWYLVEFKDFSRGISVKKLAKTISSFANTDGGEIYLGVTDQRQTLSARHKCVKPLLVTVLARRR